MVKELYCPDQIPINYFYFGWKKALSFVQKDHGIFDPMELKEFEINLDDELSKIKDDFANKSYSVSPTLTYLLPKAPKDENKRFRPMVQFSIRDQVAWATVILVLGEWFDSAEEISELMPITETNLKDIYNWMVPWSLNNRIKRIFHKDDLSDQYKRLYIHYNHPSLYESFQWGLHNLREVRKSQFTQVFSKNKDEAFYGEADIQEFYPSLEMGDVLRALKNRLNTLVSSELIDKNCCEDWKELLGSISNFEIDFEETLAPEELTVEKLNKSILDIGGSSPTQLIKKLKTTLPIGLISSGFLANCALTEFFDRSMDKFCKAQTEKGEPTFITRYTDDMMIISSSEKVVKRGLKEIERLLQDRLNLKLSEEKVRPKIRSGKRLSDIKLIEKRINSSENDPELKKILDDRLKDIKLEEECPKITIHDRIPGSTAVIEKLSQIGDNKLWGMNNRELDEYVLELLKLIDTKFDKTEIRDDTKVTFAAWRLRCGVEEALLRELPIQKYVKDDILKGALLKYPFKASLVDYYTMHLFDRSGKESIAERFSSFLQMFDTVKYKQVNYLGAYGSYLRTRVMMSISNNWNKVPYPNRRELKGVIFDCVMKWYSSQPVWHEKVALYWMLSVTDIRREPGAVDINFLEQEKQAVVNSYAIYKINNRVTQFLFDDNTSQRNDPAAERSLSESKLRVMIDIFKLRRYKNDRGREITLQEEKDWIKWLWGYIKEKYPEQEGVQDDVITFCLTLAVFRKDLITKHGFKLLLNYKKTSESNKKSLKIFNGILLFLDGVINDWAHYRDNYDHVDILMNVLNEDLNLKKSIPKYIINRFKKLSHIKQALCMDSNGMSVLPEKIKKDFGDSHNQGIPLHDWLVCLAGYSKDKSTSSLTNPLSELEILSIFNAILGKIDKVNDFTNVSTRSITVKISEWIKWRKNLVKIEGKNKSKLKLSILEPKNLHKPKYDPERMNMNQILDVIRDFTHDSKNKDIQRNFQDFDKCFLLSVLLLRMLSGNKFRGEDFNVIHLFRWRGVQNIIKAGSGPSTEIIALIVSSLNIFQAIYQTQYSDLGNLKLPYRQMSKNDTIDFKEYRKRIENLYKSARTNYLTWGYGILELVTINMDLFIKEE
jgi:hypothetical protein